MFFLAIITEDSRDQYSGFEREAVPHMNALYNFALKMTGDSDDASDLLQETYLKAFRFFHKFEQGTNCKAWLFRIMKNTYINSYRKASKEPVKIDYEEAENYYENVKVHAGNYIDKDAYDNLLDDELSEVMASLPENFRSVILLCDIEGFSYEEIAELINCPVGTVRSRLHRARKVLFTKLYDYASDKGYTKKG